MYSVYVCACVWYLYGVHAYVCLCMVCIHVYKCVCTDMSMCGVCMCVYGMLLVYVHMYTMYVYVCMYVWYVCVHVCVGMYTFVYGICV